MTIDVAKLREQGDAGLIAELLLRLVVATERRRPHKLARDDIASHRRRQVIDGLCRALLVDMRLRWGWKTDPSRVFDDQLLYVDLPTGQVHFRDSRRGPGPEYAAEWDGTNDAGRRVRRFAEAVASGRVSKLQSAPLSGRQVPRRAAIRRGPKAKLFVPAVHVVHLPRHQPGE